jgi:hypothetical protein
MTTFPTGQVLLDGAILTLIRYARANNEPMNAANISLLGVQRFNDTFPELSQQEVDDAILWLATNEPPTAEPDPVAIGDEEAAAFNAHRARQRAPLVAPDAEPVKPVPEISRDAAQKNVRLATDNLARARRDLMTAQAASKAARGVLSEKVSAWQRGGAAPMTQDDLKREFLHSEQMERERNGPDRRYARSAKAYTQKMMRYGGNRRGAFSMLELQRMSPAERAFVGAQAARMRGDVPLTADMMRPKLPSER